MLIVQDRQELLALNRALMEVRYLADAVDDATRGSAHLSDLHGRVVEAIKDDLRDAGDTAGLAQWENWSLLQGRQFELPAVIAYLTRFWPTLRTPEAKRTAVRTLLVPFTFTDDDVTRLVAQLDGTQAQ